VNRPRKILLTIVLVIVMAAHVALFAAGGQWRTVGLILIAVDIVGSLFVVGAVREFKKLDEKEKP